MVFEVSPELIKLFWKILEYFCIACLIGAVAGGIVPFFMKGGQKEEDYVRSLQKSIVVVLTIIVIWAIILGVITINGYFVIL